MEQQKKKRTAGICLTLAGGICWGLSGRDAANLVELIVLSNLENLNAEFIKAGLSQAERLKRLHDTAISQLRSIAATASIQRLKDRFDEE